MTLYGAAADPPLKSFRHEPAWTAVMRASPLHAHWLEGEPMTGILPMGGVLDRRRRLPADGSLTGVALLADAWACTNPSVGRGMTFGLMHGALLRDTLREHAGGTAAFAAAWDEVTEREMAPWYEATVSADRARMDQLRAARDGGPYVVPADPASRLRAALPLAMGVDADAFRAGMEIVGCLALPGEVFARPGLAERVTRAAARRAATPPARPGPGRAAGDRQLRRASRPRCRGRRGGRGSRALDRVLDRAEALDLAAHDVARLEEPRRVHRLADALRGAGQDQVAGRERAGLGDEVHERPRAEHEVGGGRVLAGLAVDLAGDAQALRRRGPRRRS